MFKTAAIFKMINATLKTAYVLVQQNKCKQRKAK